MSKTKAEGQPVTWAYGITTVAERQYNYLPKTIESLRQGGFDKPTLFVDGPTGKFDGFNLPIVRRESKILAFGNWLLSLLELYVRYPHANRYAIFQDDFITYRNLKTYLDQCSLPNNGYWNLLTFPQNEDLYKGDSPGWYLSNQRGRGAVALVFPNSVVFSLLSNHTILSKPKAPKNPHRSIDGVVVTALNQIGIKEYVHYPTLVYHIGDCSSIGNRQHKKPSSFQGEDYDVTQLLQPSGG